MAKHYTAVLEIFEVEERNGSQSKDKTEVARIVVRDTSLAALVTKIGKHTAIIEEN